MNIFEQALKENTRFAFKGEVSILELVQAVEQMKRKTGQAKENFIKELENFETSLTNTLETYGKRTRRSAGKTKAQEDTELQLAIVTALLDENQDFETAQMNAADVKRKRQDILESLAEIEKAEQKAKTKEQLLADLEKLG